MRNAFSLQFADQAPQNIGVYWGDAGLCLVRRDADGTGTCIYQPASNDAANAVNVAPTPLAGVLQQLVANEGHAGQRLALSVAIDADDVFVRDMKVPVGLSDAELEQAAIIEAVANLPVPPEEICLDFIRLGETDTAPAGRPGLREENVRLAFCRRERLDEILAQTESAPVSVRVVDRDAQALHDMAAAHLATQSHGEIESIYPFALLLTEIKPRLVICLAPLALESYALRLPSGDAASWVTEIGQQISSCWLRCRMGRDADHVTDNTLRHVVCIGAADAAFRTELAAHIGLPVLRLPIKEQAWLTVGGVVPPDEALLIAAGMAGRT